MTAMARWVGYSTGWVFKQLAIDPFLPWYLEAGSELAIGAASQHALTRPYMRAGATRTGQFVIQRAIQPAAVRVAVASGTIALYSSAITAGYAIGATVGTGVSYALYGESGARDALDLYSGRVSPSQYAEIVGGALGVS